MSRYNSRTQRWLKTILPLQLGNLYQKNIDENNISKWENSDQSAPPPHAIKVRTVKQFQQKTTYQTLVETGTFMGDMIVSQLSNFDKIYSIELNKDFWLNAKELFKNEPKVTLLQGDSGIVMHQLIKEINTPAIFWLDGHYSGGDTAKGEKLSPIYEELKAIFSVQHKHCILIDDARLFNGTEDYPTIEELTAFIIKNRPEATIEIEADTIRVMY